MKKLIMVSYTQDGTVLDHFLGSGTTLRACRENERNGIGFEIFERNPKYEPEIKKRIAEKQGLEKFVEEGS